MDIIWEYLTNYIEPEDLVGRVKGVKIIFGINKLVKDLKESNCPAIYNSTDDSCIIANDPRNPSVPRRKWVKVALDELVSMEYLTKGEKKGKYILDIAKYRRLTKPLTIFIKKYSQKQVKKSPSKKPSPKQIKLFKNNNHTKDSSR